MSAPESPREAANAYLLILFESAESSGVFTVRVSSDASEPALDSANGSGFLFQCTLCNCNGCHRSNVIHRKRRCKGALLELTSWLKIRMAR